MRTCVRMPRPFRPARELEAHLARGELDFALALAQTLARERSRPLELELMLRFLPLVAVQRPDSYDEWALRWLERWSGELRGRASIDEAVEVAGALAEIPVDPDRGLHRISATGAIQRGE